MNYKINETINQIKKTDGTRFLFENAILAILTSLDNYFNNFCLTNPSNQIDCLLSGSNSSNIKPFLKNVTLDTDSLGNKNVKIFNNTDCNGYSQTYVVFHVYGSISVPTYMQ